MGNERVGSVKWALEGHGDPLKHPIPAKGTSGRGRNGQLIKWNRNWNKVAER